MTQEEICINKVTFHSWLLFGTSLLQRCKSKDTEYVSFSYFIRTKIILQLASRRELKDLFESHSDRNWSNSYFKSNVLARVQLPFLSSLSKVFNIARQCKRSTHCSFMQYNSSNEQTVAEWLTTIKLRLNINQENNKADLNTKNPAVKLIFNET